MKTQFLKNVVNEVSLGILESQEISNDEKIGILLGELGIAAHPKGYQYLKQALVMRISDDDPFSISKYYIEIANLFNTTDSRVERAIRHTIGITPYRTNLFDFIFSHTVNTSKRMPSNKHYIEQVASFYKTFIE